ncbi:MAG: type IV pili twitching motility protein PilT [Bdellovibrionaceae bacterium]|nr:type IV pili twitching motility protein PilT [Pseudobdellovibrionaceae bacterium]|tara:strand:+ start:3342 stop:4562 length:1221 start_codon:yes stop_codon:yes gene_type:complete
MTLDEILKASMQKGASDIHLKAGLTPVIRKDGLLRPLSSRIPPLTIEQMDYLAQTILDDQQKETLKNLKEVDAGYGVSGLGRFRVSLFYQRGTLRIVIRAIPHVVPTIESLNLPAVLNQIAQVERGLILVTGVTGSGKSSTLAAIVDDINKRTHKHILTLEDPIEYLIRDRKSLITQREVGSDTTSFAKALRAGLRQDPDVILVGEMRDRETVEIALMAAETGHLVLSTLHTMDATETVNRILSYFEGTQQRQIRIQLASVLQAIISQRLCVKADQSGMVPAVEILRSSPRVKGMIVNPEHTKDLIIAIEEGYTAWGMRSFDQSLMGLLERKSITLEEALRHASRAEDFRIKLDGIASMDGRAWSTEHHTSDSKKDWSQDDSADLEVMDPRNSESKSSGSGKKSKK